MEWDLIDVHEIDDEEIEDEENKEEFYETIKYLLLVIQALIVGPIEGMSRQHRRIDRPLKR